jgi:hypothetical protein
MPAEAAINNDLAILSLRVAQQVDRKLHGETADPKVFSDFKRELALASGLGEPNATAFLHSDPATTEVFAQAIRKVSAEPLSDIASLGSALTKIIEPFEVTGNVTPTGQLNLLKAFCLSLHKSMVGQRLPAFNDGERTFDDELRFVR